jgi:hypothetical protein
MYLDRYYNIKPTRALKHGAYQSQKSFGTGKSSSVTKHLQFLLPGTDAYDRYCHPTTSSTQREESLLQKSLSSPLLVQFKDNNNTALKLKYEFHNEAIDEVESLASLSDLRVSTSSVSSLVSKYTGKMSSNVAVMGLAVGNEAVTSTTEMVFP